MAFGFSQIAVLRSTLTRQRGILCHQRHRRHQTSPAVGAATLQAAVRPASDVTERLVTFCTNSGVERDLAKRVVEGAQRAVREWTTVQSEFVTPPESVALETAVGSLPDVCVLPWGGYDEAERRMLFVAHAEVAPSTSTLLQLAKEQVVLLRIIGDFENVKVSHRDFMGAVLNAGISRQKIGDIIVLEGRGAQVMANAEVVEFLQGAVTSVRQVSVQVQVADEGELEVPEKRVKEMQSVESSMRLDAVVSAGFKLSRSKFANMVRSGLVNVNYKEMKAPAKCVKSGDVVSVRGVDYEQDANTLLVLTRSFIVPLKMVNERDTQLVALRAEIAQVRTESEKRVDKLKNLLTESKNRAKSIISKQKDESQKKIQLLEEDANLRSEELAQLKDMLRQAESIKSALSGEASVLKQELRSSSETIESLTGENQTAKEKTDHLRTTLDSTNKHAVLERNRLEKELALTKDKLKLVENELHTKTFDAQQLENLSQESQAVQPSHPTEGSEDQPTTLPSTQLLSTTPSPHSDSSQPSEELRQSKEQSDQLSEQLQQTISDLKSRNGDHDKEVTELKAKRHDLEQKISKAEAHISELKAQLKKSEESLQREKDNVVKAKAAPSAPTANTDESKKVLEAKVAEMERLVAAKQAEIGKVREKARTYLKEINTEKRTMEEKKKEEVGALQKELEHEHDKVSAADDRADIAVKEMDNCLAVIREKQKSMQMLKMSVSTYKNTTEEANRQTESLRTEFVRYKERARLALQERENVASASEADIESATSVVRSDLERARKESQDLKKRIAEIRRAEQMVDELRERAQRAEAVAELLRKDATGMETTNYSQVDRLEGKVAKLESELSSARSGIEDAEARHATTKMRLEGAEKALRSAELRAKETGIASGKRIDGLKQQVVELERELKRAREASEAAQRTATAAAKALTFSSFAEGKEVGSPSKRKDDMDGVDSSGYDLDMEVNGNRTSLAIAIEGHSDRLGLSPTNKREARVSGSDGSDADAEADLQAKEQQIKVLTSQLAELGVMFDEVQQESELRTEQTDMLKSEVKNLDAKLVSAEKLQNGAPFNYLRTVVVRYLETDDATLLPVICNVLSFSDDEASRVKEHRAVKGSTSSTTGWSSKGGYFSLPFLGSG